MRRASMATVLLFVYAIPAATIVLLDRHDDGGIADVIAPSGEPLVAVAQAQALVDRQPVQVTPRFDGPSAVVAPAWSGTVTASPLARGAAVVTGTVVAQVDGIDRIAYAAPSPLFRPLVEGDTGAAVVAFRAVLASLGFLANPGRSDAYDAAVVAAVGRLATAIGAPADGTTFDPGWLVWLPADSVAVASVDLTIATPAPAPGTPIIVGAARLTGLALSRDDAGVDAPGRWTLTVLGLEIALEDGNATSGALAALDELVDPDAPPLEGSVARAEARDAVVVVPSAVTPGTGGRACIWVPEGDDTTRFGARSVIVGGGGPSTVEVDGVVAGTRYLANPTEVLSDLRCP